MNEQLADLALARRLESAEAYSCEQFAKAGRKLFPVQAYAGRWPGLA